MKYLCLAYYDVKAMAATPKAELDAVVSQCPAHDAALRASGRLVAQASLGAPERARVVRPRKGKATVTDGPFTESKELVGGFFLLEASDMDEAVRVASLHPAAELGETMGWGIEIWPLDSYEEYGA